MKNEPTTPKPKPIRNGTYTVTSKLFNLEDRARIYNGSACVQGVWITMAQLRNLYTLGERVKAKPALYDLIWFMNGKEKQVLLRAKPYPVCVGRANELRRTVAAFSVGLLKPIRQINGI